MEPPAVTPHRVYSRDTRLRHADCAACEISQRYRSLIDAGPSVIVCLSIDNLVIDFNHAAEELFGRRRDEVLGRNYLKLFRSEIEQKAIAGYIKQARAGNPIRGVESSVRTPIGEERFLLWSTSRILDADHETIGVITVGKDVTKLKRTEADLRRYEQIIFASRDFIAFVGIDYVFQAVNETYLEAIGRRPDEIMGRQVSVLIGDDTFEQQIKPKLDRCFAGERVTLEMWLDFPRLGSRCLDVHFNPFRDAQGPVSGAVVVARDVTERQRADQALLMQKQQLQALASELALAEQRERRRVALGLHDQVGQALAMAKLKLRAALDFALPADARRALEESEGLLNQSIQATRSLTFQLSSAVLQELGLVAALEQLVEWFDANSQDTRFEFEFVTPSGPLSEDQNLMLYDMARELLFNAEKHARAQTVRLAVVRKGNRLQIIIEDDGVGFDTTHVQPGPSSDGGFGHFSIRERLIVLGGALEVSSRVGVGTRAAIAVPLPTTDIAVTRI